ncbi:hypothetical protein TcasGA2_TC001494 [Tribolium castaneum]|uniref:Uncharacterized protein n=1 Tax=Tribolium castaneum TaxID=7070 RepID=D7ELB5_TRICA|nr:hypothetical protein TcasGA2_TC001494 [Tribolium castaneum]
MEHAKKVIMVDPAVIERMQSGITNQPNIINDLDREMRRIIELKHIDDNEKWTLYNQVLQRYLKVINRSRKPVTIPMIKTGKKMLMLKIIS